ncbi:MAG TPA: metalloregulator ArsR/SmtB family transcription factor [Prolixibacteraceae bacterium]|nr:metalloregulator ArsR/SmtB family transcription factor [Prolixibacteraceae bacterium]
MVASKTELFDTPLVEQAKYFKALAHPARLSILKYLAETKTCISGDISDELPLSRTTVSQHLNELKSAGLIKGHVSGVKTNYCLDAGTNKILIEELNHLIQELKPSGTIKCTADF